LFSSLRGGPLSTRAAHQTTTQPSTPGGQTTSRNTHLVETSLFPSFCIAFFAFGDLEAIHDSVNDNRTGTKQMFLNAHIVFADCIHQNTHFTGRVTKGGNVHGTTCSNIRKQ